MQSQIKKLKRAYRRSCKMGNTDSFVSGAMDSTEYQRLTSDLLRKNAVQNMGTHIQHSDVTTLEHVISVSFISYLVCKKLGWDYKAAARAGILHDLVYYDWHDTDPSHRLHGFHHPTFALYNARELTPLSNVEENIILRHMWPLTPVPPKYKEAVVVSLVDKYCATMETCGLHVGSLEEK